MRQERTVQASIFDRFTSHEIRCELKGISDRPDERRGLVGLVARDLCRHSVKATGRQGLPAEAVSRCALLKQCRQLSYPGAGLPSGGLRLVLRFRGAAVVMVPAEVGGVEDINLIRPGTWEEINRALLLSARQARLEEGSVVRLVSTVTPQHRSMN